MGGTMNVPARRKGPTQPRRKVALAALAGAIIAAIAAFLWHSAPQTPHVAEQLSAHDTVGFIAMESPDRWLQELDRAAAGLSDEEKRNLAPLLSPDVRRAALGFDPRSAADWQKAGMDPERGLAMTLDARGATGAMPTPFFWIAGGPPKLAKADALKWQAFAQWSVAALPSALAPAATWTAAEGPKLDRDPVLRAAFADMPTGPRTAFYAHADGLLALLKPQFEGNKLATLEHVAQRVRGLALVIAPERVAGRLVLSSEGVESLRQIFGNGPPKQKFSDHLPDDGVLALRVSLNLQELFDGLMTWLPPQWLEARLGLASTRLGMLAMTGLDWTQLERALSGQAVLALDLSAPATADTPVPWLALLAVRDGAVADAALTHLAQQGVQRGKPVRAAQIAGHAGWQLLAPPLVVVRVADTLIVAPSIAAAERALHQPKPMADTANLDGDVVLGLVFRPTAPHAAELAGEGWLKKLAGFEPLSAAVRRDTHGLRLEASALPLASVLHLVTWVMRAPVAP